MQNLDFLIKIENGEQHYIAVGEHGDVYASQFSNTISNGDLEYFKKVAFETEPRKMIAIGNVENLSLSSEVYRLSGINNKKPETKFTVKHVRVDFDTVRMTVINQWDYDVKQWPNGHVRITEVI